MLEDYVCRKALIGYCLSTFLFLSSDVLPSERNDSPQPVNIEITTHLGDKQTFIENDVISFLLTLDKDAYITAIYQDAKNNLIQVLPNRSQPDNYYKEGLFIPIPPKNSSYQFKVQSPYGEEKLWVFATDQVDINLEGDELESGLIILKRSIREIKQSILQQSASLYGEASLTIKSKPR